MNPVEPTQEMKACPFCAEQIQAAAIKCRYCQTMLADTPASRSGEKVPAPGIIRLLVANLFCPGMGAWRMGHRMRGGIFLLVVLLASLFWMQDAMNKAGKIAQKAVKTHNTKNLEKDMESLRENPWYDVAFWGYALSFVDLLFLYYSSRKVSPNIDPPPDS